MTASGLVEFERLIMNLGMSYELGYDSPHKLGVLGVGQLPSTSPEITALPEKYTGLDHHSFGIGYPNASFDLIALRLGTVGKASRSSSW